MSERAVWDRLADDWLKQVGTQGDRNRYFNSDPVLWRFAGDVLGRRVLDAGCGTGYLSGQLDARGALVRGVDVSSRMIDIARGQFPDIAFALDSCAVLDSVANASVDLIVSNYVLMDLEDLEGAMRSFARVLVDGGEAVVVFAHPCFPQGVADVSIKGRKVRYSWQFPYFERNRCAEPAWGHFRSEFLWYHRPLSDYWKAFLAAGFLVADFEEPRLDESLVAEIENEKTANKFRTRPFSVAFRLVKGGSIRS